MMISHEQREQTIPRSPDFEKGYQRGYWHQPELEGQSDEWKKGYLKGWNDRVLDRR